jgi:tetratricopeptide (TPR) repeat protein
VYQKTHSYYDKLLKIEQKLFLQIHPSLAISYSNIGYVYNDMQEYSKVLSYYQKDLPANHSSLATSYNSISVVYDNMSRGQGGKGETPVFRSTGGVQAENVKYGGVLEYWSPAFSPLVEAYRASYLHPAGFQTSTSTRKH